MSPFLFCSYLAGVVSLLFGLFAVRKNLSAARGLDKVLPLGRVFTAASLALFGAEHLAGARFVMQVVPVWMPWRLFWTYFVGVALIAAAVSMLLSKYVRLSATLLGIMLFLFVLLLHVPKVAANPGDRIAWAVALRDLAFAGGAWALAGAQTGDPRGSDSHWLTTIARFCIAIPILFFAVEHFLHPEFAPGVPLAKVTPLWIPLRAAWGYLTGSVLLVSGICLLIRMQARMAAILLGVTMTLLVVFIYMPIWASATQPSEMTEGMNYAADTLLFAGAALLLAAALPRESIRQPHAPPLPAV